MTGDNLVPGVAHRDSSVSTTPAVGALWLLTGAEQKGTPFLGRVPAARLHEGGRVVGVVRGEVVA